MTRLVWLITHADVVIDPAVPVPDWGLNPKGAARHAALAESWAGGHPHPDAIWSSAEQKSRDGADALSTALNMPVRIDEDLGEIDRSASGFIPEPEFSRVAEALFAFPDRSTRGWERAVDAQARMVAAVDRVVEQSPGSGSIAIVTHGAVATLLISARLGEPISTARSPGFPGGGGICALDGASLKRGWRPIEATDALELSEIG